MLFQLKVPAIVFESYLLPNATVLLNADGASLIDNLAKSRLLEKEDTWYVADSLDKLPVFERSVHCTILHVSSPKRGGFDKFKGEVITMPEWSMPQMEQLHKQCFPSVTDSQFHERLALCGGVPRLVFELSDQAFDGAMLAAVERSRTTDFTALVLELAVNDVVHTLMHYWPSGIGYDQRNTTTVKFASPAVAEMLFEMERQKHGADFLKLMDGLRSVAGAGSLRGDWWEYVAHGVLSKATNMEVALLSSKPCDNTIMRIVLKLHSEELKSQTFNHADEIHLCNKLHYFRPVFRVLTAIDSIVVTHEYIWLFQMTIARKHPLKIKGLVHIHRELLSSSTCRELALQGKYLIIFVCPAHEGVFVRQSFTRRKSDTQEGSDNNDNDDEEQEIADEDKESVKKWSEEEKIFKDVPQYRLEPNVPQFQLMFGSQSEKVDTAVLIENTRKRIKLICAGGASSSSASARSAGI